MSNNKKKTNKKSNNKKTTTDKEDEHFDRHLAAGREALANTPRSESGLRLHTNSCRKCGNPAVRTCSGCNVARYCTLECQKEDWNKSASGHRLECKQIQAERQKLAELDGALTWSVDNKALVAIVVTHDMREFCSNEEIIASSGLSHVSCLLMLQGNKTLGPLLHAPSTGIDVAAIQYIASNMLQQFAMFPKERNPKGPTGTSCAIVDRMLVSLTPEQTHSWFMPTGSPDAVKEYVKFARKCLRKKLKPVSNNGNVVMQKVQHLIQSCSKKAPQNGTGQFPMKKISCALDQSAMKSLSSQLFPRYIERATGYHAFPAGIMSLGTPIVFNHYINTTYFRHIVMSTTKKGLCVHSIIPPPGVTPGLIDVDAMRKEEKKKVKAEKKKKKREAQKRNKKKREEENGEDK